MEPITSGSTTERIVRTSAVTLLALGAAVWCFYDGYIGYPMENLRRAVADLNSPPKVARQLIVEAINEETAATITKGTLLKDLRARFGPRDWRGPIEKGKSEARFFGPAGQMIFTLNPGEAVVEGRFEPAQYKRAKDLTFQKGMGVAIAGIALVLIVFWFRVMFVKVTMTDQGIRMTGGPLVPFEAITAMHTEDYAKKGWLDIEYEIDGRTGLLRLDDYKIKAFPRIVEEICERRGYENPHKKWLEHKKAAVK